MEITKKHIYAIDFAIIVGTLITLIGVVGYARPLVIAPINELNTTSTSVLFEFEKAEMVLIDDNFEFTSPDKMYAKDNLVINLKPGVYYWKVSGALESEIRTLTILSKVDLKLRSAGDRFEVVNVGNVGLSVDIYDNKTLVGNIKLERDESRNVSGTAFVGRQDE